MLQVVITVLAAAFYNLFAELFGGIEVTVVEEETIAGSVTDVPLPPERCAYPPCCSGL